MTQRRDRYREEPVVPAFNRRGQASPNSVADYLIDAVIQKLSTDLRMRTISP
jgi:hypothetical protein